MAEKDRTEQDTGTVQLDKSTVKEALKELLSEMPAFKEFLSQPKAAAPKRGHSSKDDPTESPTGSGKEQQAPTGGERQ